MRIAISSQTSNGLDSTIAQDFGRCPYFALVDIDDNEVQAINVIAPLFMQGIKRDKFHSSSMNNKPTS